MWAEYEIVAIVKTAVHEPQINTLGCIPANITSVALCQIRTPNITGIIMQPDILLEFYSALWARCEKQVLQ